MNDPRPTPPTISGNDRPFIEQMAVVYATEIERLRSMIEADNTDIETHKGDIDRLWKENEKLRAALEEIISPLSAIQKRAEAEGAKLSDIAYNIANSVSHLQEIARRALEK